MRACVRHLCRDGENARRALHLSRNRRHRASSAAERAASRSVIEASRNRPEMASRAAQKVMRSIWRNDRGAFYSRGSMLMGIPASAYLCDSS